jgi:hypothetical protein
MAPWTQSGCFTSMLGLIIPEVSRASSFSLSASVRLMRSRLRHVLFVLVRYGGRDSEAPHLLKLPLCFLYYAITYFSSYTPTWRLRFQLFTILLLCKSAAHLPTLLKRWLPDSASFLFGSRLFSFAVSRMWETKYAQ